MKIDIVIANPPYSVGPNHLCEKIDNEIKAKKPKSFISVQPIYATTTYKTAEQIQNVFLKNCAVSFVCSHKRKSCGKLGFILP